MSEDTKQPESDTPEAAPPAAESAVPEAPATETPAANEASVAEAPAAEIPVTEVSAAVAEEAVAVETAAVEPVADEAADALDDEADGEEEDVEEIAVAPAGPIEVAEEDDEEIRLDWYILKVQSNRERTSSEALKRKIAIEGLDHLFGEVIVPTEKVTEFKNGKKKTVSRKIWPGYIAVQMHVNDDTWFAIRETSGIGDFTGASGKPVPMSAEEVAKILPKEEGEESEEDTPKLNIKFKEGDKVKVTDGNFENFEGEVDSIDQHSGKITVMISIFGRSTPVELEYWQVESL